MKSNFLSSQEPARPTQGIGQKEVVLGNIFFGILYTAILTLVFAAFVYYGAIIIRETLSFELTEHSGRFGLVADDGGRTEYVGYVREYTRDIPDGIHYSLPVDLAIPHYTAIFVGGVPEIGTWVNFYRLEIRYKENQSFFWKLSLVY